MIVHALRVATVVGSGRIADLSIAEKCVTVLRRGNRAADFPSIVDGVAHSTDSGECVCVACILDIGRDTWTSWGVCVERMGAIDKCTDDATEAAKHVRTANNFFSGQGQTEPDDVDKVALKDSSVLQITLRLLLRKDQRSSTLTFNFLELLTSLTFFFRCLAFFCLFGRLFGVEVIKFEVVLVVQRPTSWTSPVETLPDGVQAPKANLVAALARLDCTVGGIKLLETKWTGRNIILILVHAGAHTHSFLSPITRFSRSSSSWSMSTMQRWTSAV